MYACVHERKRQREREGDRERAREGEREKIERITIFLKRILQTDRV